MRTRVWKPAWAGAMLNVKERRHCKAMWVLERGQRSNAAPERWGYRGAFLLTLSSELELCPGVCSTLGKSEPKPRKPDLQGASAGMVSPSCTEPGESVLSLPKCASSPGKTLAPQKRHLSGINKRDENSVTNE